MIIADTSVWIEHLNHGDPFMLSLLADGQILMHPFVVGELSLGSMRNWNSVMFRLLKIPAARRAGDQAIVTLISERHLRGSGIGYVGAHLLGSCLLATGTLLWTRDRRLAAVAARLGIDATNP